MDERQREAIDRFANGYEITAVSPTRPYLRGVVTELQVCEGGADLKIGHRHVIFGHRERVQEFDRELNLWLSLPFCSLEMPDDSILVRTEGSVNFVHTWEYTLGLVGLVRRVGVREVLTSDRVHMVVAVLFDVVDSRMNTLEIGNVWVGSPRMFTGSAGRMSLTLSNSVSVLPTRVVRVDEPISLTFSNIANAYVLPSGSAFYVGSQRVIFFLTEVPK